MPATLTDIAPGSDVKVTITKTPTNAAAEKTLVRLLHKDAAVAAEQKRLQKSRRKNEKLTVRGGRLRVWEHRQVKIASASPTLGTTGTLKATVDVLRDLASVDRFVEVTPA
ncbi:MAG: hypothetical protein AAF797_03315 [Planctomycetota bacterium]